MASPLRIRAQRPGARRVRLVLSGELDAGGAAAFEGRLRAEEARRPDLLEIDLRDLAFLDSTGVSVLLGAARRARSDRRRLVVRLAPGAQAAQALRLMGVDRRLELALG